MDSAPAAPAPAGPVHPQSSMPSEPTHVKGPKHGLFIALFVIILAFVGGVGVWAYTYVYSIPDDQIARVLQAAEDGYDSARTKVGVRVQVLQDPTWFSDENEVIDQAPFDLEALREITFSLDSSYEKSQPPKFDTLYRMSAGDVIGDLQVHVKMLDEVIYASVENIPTVGIIDLNGMFDGWYSFDYGELKSGEGEFADFGQVLPSDEEAEELKKEAEKLYALLREHPPITITKVHFPKNLGEFSMRHVSYELNKDELLAFAEAAGREFDDILSESDVEDLEQALEYLDGLHGEMWIGRKDHRVYRFTAVADAHDDSEGQYRVTLDSSISNINQPVVVEPPAVHTPILQLIEEQLGGLGGFGGSSVTINLDDAYDRAWAYSSSLATALTVWNQDYGTFPQQVTNLKAGQSYMIGTAENCETLRAACAVEGDTNADIAITECIDLSVLKEEGYLREMPVADEGIWDLEQTGFVVKVWSDDDYYFDDPETSSSAGYTIDVCKDGRSTYGSSVFKDVESIIGLGASVLVPQDKLPLGTRVYKTKRGSEGMMLPGEAKEDASADVFGLAPISSEGTSTDEDADNDGLLDYEEQYIYGTDPQNSDTDGDGFLDGDEVTNGYDPLKKPE